LGGRVRRDARCVDVAWKTKIKFGENVVDDFLRDPTVDQVLRWNTISKNVKNNFLSGVILSLCYCENESDDAHDSEK
jgi:hypothetical protein